MNTRLFLGVVLATLAAAVPSPAAEAGAAPTLTWHELKTWPIEGKGWMETKRLYDRLPASAETAVGAPVWNLAKHSAGLSLRFVTDATQISARWKLLKPDQLAMSHMAATGVSGLDLYVRDAGEWRWIGIGRPDSGAIIERSLTTTLTKGPTREFRLYLPLYNGVESLELGVPVGAVFQAAPDRYVDRKPIVFYGTSITQGGCASRAGMAYPSLIGRALDWPVVNLGFSGNGRAEPEFAELLAGLDPAVYVLDSLPNLGAAEVRERLPPFIAKLRAARPATPIVLVENINYPDSGESGGRRSIVADGNAVLRRLYDQLAAAGDQHLHYIRWSHLLGGDGEDTVDGTHVTDLGFSRMAQGMAPYIREALAGAGINVPDGDGFEALFDGKTLAGWAPHDGLPDQHRGGKWWVENGALCGTQDPPGRGGMLWMDRPFRDFILKFQVKLSYPMDTGVFLRIGAEGRSHQMTIDYRSGSEVGAIFIPFIGHGYVQRNQEGARLVRPDDWNDFTIRIEGEPARIRVWLNDRQLTDFQHTEKTTEGVPPRGGIALQVHPDVPNLTVWKPGAAVQYRNIRIKELRR